MKTLALLTLSAAVLVSSSAFAQGLTRSEVRQQLVEAQQNGSEYVSNASYPDIPPVFQNHAGAPRARLGGTQAPEACVGPVSFCNIYSGS
jgi:hypothetical protein